MRLRLTWRRSRALVPRIVAVVTCGLAALSPSALLAREVVRVGSTLDLVPLA
jgi:hypothetical protein